MKHISGSPKSTPLPYFQSIVWNRIETCRHFKIFNFDVFCSIF